jgi:hypothetical protein
MNKYSLTLLNLITMSVYKTRIEMAEEYGLDRVTFVKEVERHNIELRPRVPISPAEQDEIYNKMGKPDGNLKRRR